jgi:hypothetical protein
MQLTLSDQIAAIRTCLHHTIRVGPKKSRLAVYHWGAVPQIESWRNQRDCGDNGGAGSR